MPLSSTPLERHSTLRLKDIMVEEVEETKTKRSRKGAKLATSATVEYTDDMLNFLASPPKQGYKSNRNNKKLVKNAFSNNSL